MGVSRNGNGAINDRADECPDEPGDHLAIRSHDLQTERQAVDIGAIIRNDAQRQDDEAKVTEAAKRRLQHCAQQAANVRSFIPSAVSWVWARGGSRNSEPEPLCEA